MLLLTMSCQKSSHLMQFTFRPSKFFFKTESHLHKLQISVICRTQLLLGHLVIFVSEQVNSSLHFLYTLQDKKRRSSLVWEF